MTPDEYLDKLNELRRLSGEKMHIDDPELALTIQAAGIRVMAKSELLKMRRDLADVATQRGLVDLIDGHLALRELGEITEPGPTRE